MAINSPDAKYFVGNHKVRSNNKLFCINLRKQKKKPWLELTRWNGGKKKTIWFTKLVQCLLFLVKYVRIPGANLLSDAKFMFAFCVNTKRGPLSQRGSGRGREGSRWNCLAPESMGPNLSPLPTDKEQNMFFSCCQLEGKLVSLEFNECWHGCCFHLVPNTVSHFCIRTENEAWLLGSVHSPVNPPTTEHRTWNNTAPGPSAHYVLAGIPEPLDTMVHHCCAERGVYRYVCI